jgi:hypothetical protein
MRPLRVAMLVSICLTAGLAPAAQAQPSAGAAPLRHLSYEISFVATTRIEEVSTGANPGLDPGAHDSINTIREGAGRLEVDVIAATNDRGLVVDALVAGPERKADRTRFAIGADGKLFYDPKNNVLEEEVRLLPLLSQGRFDRALEIGEIWHVPIRDPNASGEEVVRILKYDGNRASAEITGSVDVRGPNAYSETSRLLTDYDVHLVTPVTADLDVHTRRTTGLGQTTYIDTQLHLKLVGDTFHTIEGQRS